MPSTWGQRQQYGEFRIVGAADGRPKLLGEGSFGKTFEAVRSDSVAGNVIEENVALKVLNPELLNSESKRVQFVREHTALTRLKHANLVHSIKCGEDNGEVYFAMELCMGGDLAGLVKRFGALPERVAALIGHQAAAGLREMHRREMIHRDIKPPNIMLFEAVPADCTLDGLTLLLEDNDNLCRIVDFGLVGTIIKDTGAADPAVTQKFAGTMMYASPEQILKRETIDGRTDIYALGMTLWYLVQGRGPLLDDRGDELTHVTEAEQKHLSSQEHEPSLPTNLTKEFRGILARMVAKRPEDRFASAKDLSVALERYLEKSARVRSVALTPVQSKENLQSFFNFSGDTLKSIGRMRFEAENCSMKKRARVTIVEDLDDKENIRPDFNDVVKKVFSLAHTLRQADVPATLLPVQDVVWAADALAYAEDMPGDVPLSEVLQARTASRRPFSFREAEVIFRPIATALDHLINHGWDLISLPCEEVWLSDPEVAAAPEDRKVLCRPLDEWTGLRVTFSGMWVPPQKGKDTGAEMLYASTSEADSSLSSADSLRPPVSAFLRLVYRTLSGSDVPDAADRWQNGYISSVSLQNASNNLIRDLLCKQREWSAVSLILNELCANEGVSVDASAVPRSRRGSSRTKGSSSRIAAAPGATAASMGSVGSSESAAHSASASAHQPPPWHSSSSSQQSARASSAHASSWRSKTQASAAEHAPEPPAYSFEETPRRGKLGWIIAAVALLVVSAVAAFFLMPKKRQDLADQIEKIQTVPPEKPREDPVAPKPEASPPSKPDPAPTPPPSPKPQPTPPTPTKPAPPLSVPDGYPTIEAALAAAKPGDTVRIKSGAYEEQLRLPDGVSLVAEDSRRVSISIDGKVGSVLDADGCKTGSTIKGIVFSHSGADASAANSAPIVNVIGSTVTFDDCVFEKGLGQGLVVSSAARVTLIKCESRRNGSHGFLIRNATAEFTGCLTESNLNDGLRAFGAGCNVKTNGKTIAKRNGGTGFVAENGARITATQTDSTENSENGIAVQGADSEATWQEGTIRGNGVNIIGGSPRDSGKGGLGVSVEEGGALFSATGTVIAGNWKHGVVMMTPKSNSALIKCMVQDNHRSGVIIFGASTTAMRIEGCEITNNQEEGVVISGAGFRPVIVSTVIAGSTLTGLSVFEMAEPQLEGCTLDKNGQGPMNRAEAGPGMTVK